MAMAGSAAAAVKKSPSNGQENSFIIRRCFPPSLPPSLFEKTETVRSCFYSVFLSGCSPLIFSFSSWQQEKEREKRSLVEETVTEDEEAKAKQRCSATRYLRHAQFLLEATVLCASKLRGK